MKTLDVAAGILVNESGEFLLAQRPSGDLKGLWEFPGGKLDASESAEAALIRELKEELQVDIQILRKLGHYHHSYDWGQVHLIVFVVKALTTPRPTDAIQQFRWVTGDEARRLPLVPADLRPLEDFIADQDL